MVNNFIIKWFKNSAIYCCEYLFGFTLDNRGVYFFYLIFVLLCCFILIFIFISYVCYQERTQAPKYEELDESWCYFFKRLFRFLVLKTVFYIQVLIFVFPFVIVIIFLL